MRLTNLINPLPEGGSATTTNRVVAIWCAMQITPNNVVAAGASNTGRVTNVAQKFEEWLDKATNDDEDTYIRRALLVMVCDKADETTPDDRIRTFVKELHRHVRRR